MKDSKKKPDKKPENKYSKWVLTIQKIKGTELPDEATVKKLFEKFTDEYVFQREIGDKMEHEHYQCTFKSKQRLRQSTLLNRLSKESGLDKPVFQLDRMRGTWEESYRYCTKSECRVGDKYYTNIQMYSGSDVEFLDHEDNRHEWQNILLEQMYDVETSSFKKANDRDIVWIYDPAGNSGKSKFLKWLSLRNSKEVAKISCNTESQLRAAVISAGARKLFVVDLPRAFPMVYQYQEKLAGLLTAIEEIKNGYISSAMYGQYSTLMFDPPHILIFANSLCPTEYLSEDRWHIYLLNQNQLVNISDNTIRRQKLSKLLKEK